MNLSQSTMDVIKKIQGLNPNFLLCGSAALIMCDLLPYRDMSDIDFVANMADFEKTKLKLGYDEYSKLNHEPNYDSYSCYLYNNGLSFKINILIFGNDTKLNVEEFTLNADKIKHQKLQDIINWKEKYNRPKDLKDLDNITIKAIEDTILKEKL